MKKFISMIMVFSIIMGTILSINVIGESYNGKCGPTANWVLENGVLTISGEGELYSAYNDSDNHPGWFEHRKSIEKVVVNEGITTIYGNTFYDHSNLKTIIFPVSLSSIGYYTFNKCYNISYIDWKDWLPKEVLMYAADGRVRIFRENEVDTYKNLGWYTEPMQTLYTLDGRSKVFKKSEVQAQLTVGWYEEPVVYMYAMDGRRRITPKSEIEAYEKVNWYYGKPTKMYAPDGRVITIGENRVEEYKKVGWYKEAFVTMYALTNGYVRTKLVQPNEVEANKKVGWSLNKPKIKYSINNNTVKEKALTYLKSILKRPSSLEIYSTNLYDWTTEDDKENGCIRKCVAYDCSSLNGFGGYTRSTEYIVVKFNGYTNEYVTWLN